MDTKQLIEEARKLAEQQKEQELVKEALEVLAADPAPSTNVTPQQFLDRLVAVVKKVDERSTTKDTALHTTITTETDTKLALKQDKITTTTITIPEQIIYRTEIHSYTDLGIKDISIEHWNVDKIVSIAGKTHTSNDFKTLTVIPMVFGNKATLKDLSSATASREFMTAELSGNNLTISSGVGGTVKTDIGVSVGVQYTKTIPAQTFKVIA